MAETVDLVLVGAVTVLVIALAVALLFKSIRVVPEARVMIIERFGRYHSTLKPGLHFTIPFVDNPRSVNWRYTAVKFRQKEASTVATTSALVDLREHVIDFGRQHVITKDTVSIDNDALVYYRITDPRLAVYNIQNMPDAIELLTQTTLRNIIARMTLDDTFSSREKINEELLSKIRPDCERWGITVTRVEIMSILPPRDIKMAMEMQIREERDRRSAVLAAEGERESSIIRSKGQAARVQLKKIGPAYVIRGVQDIIHAEGRRRSIIERATGEATAKVLDAEADGKNLAIIREALGGEKVNATDYLIAQKYLSTLMGLTQNKDTVTVSLLPADTIDSVETMVSQTKVK